MNLNQLISELNAYNGMSFIKGCSFEELEYFEKSNDIQLPIKYKEWLLFSDGGELFLPSSIQLYGVKHKPIIDINDDSRPSNDYFVIGALSSGDTILVNKYNEEISIYNISDNKIEKDEIYRNFNSFLMDLENI